MSIPPITKLSARPSCSFISITTLLLVLGVPLAQAHPGHGLFDQGFAHTLTSPGHLFLLAVIGGGLFCIGRAVQTPRVRRALQSFGVVLVLGAMALWKLTT
jgi:hydrogenase/urease accessory protein HupE